MPWKGLRIGVSDGPDSQKQSVVDRPQPQSRHSEQLPRPSLSTSNLVPRHSESTPRSPRLTGTDDDDGDDDDDDANGDSRACHLGAPEGSTDTNRPASPNPGNSPASPSPGEALSGSLRRNRFSFMKLRHASDPQLSKSYAKAEQKPPPVPSIPPPPTIITTAPTSHELDQPVKRKSMFKILSASKKPSMEELPETRQSIPDMQPPPSRHAAQEPTDSRPEDTSRGSAEKSGRLSTVSAHSNTREHLNDSNRASMVTDARFSESSRSDQSHGEQGSGGGSHQKTSSSKEGGATSTGKRFRMPRLKRNRGPMFPLPPKPTPSSSSTNGRPGSTGYNPATAVDGPPKSQSQEDHQGQGQVSPVPSPTRSSMGISTSGPPPLFRNESGNSAHSATSSSSNYRKRNQPETRARSSTMDSVTENPSAAQQPPSMVPSNRTSTSTSGRKSFGDIFSFPQRLRQNSEPPAPHAGSSGTATPTKPLSYPERQEEDTPALYLSRLEESIPKGVVAGVLAQSGDDFYQTALRKCMRWFSYFGDPVDMAIRKLLMEMELPKETQQIDRFLQAFADRYHECNPGIFASSDQAYFIAFSILILHTDVFNKNNKRKMQKPDYVKNTRGEGIAEDILECFYDNISYTPFIRIEDSIPYERQVAKPRRTLFRSTSSEYLSKSSREPVDPYALILDGKLDVLRPSLKEVMDLDDAYNCNGTEGPPDMDGLHRAFARTGVLQIVSARSRPDAFMPASLVNPADSNPGLVDIKVAKVGLLWRKEAKKKRGRSPWQEWGALLTFSQLYLFRDVNWVKSLVSQAESQQKEGRREAVVFKPPITEFNPDALMSTDDAVALLDSSYKKHKHAFVFVRHNSLEEVFLANNDADMNDWIAKLNYASAFRTTGVRTKSMVPGGYDAQRNRMVHVDSSPAPLSANQEPPPSPNPETEMAEEVVVARRQLMLQRIREANEKLFVCQKQLDDLLRNARHLQLLTPVHSRAREQVVMAAGRMAAKLKWVRQDIWRCRCHREVLVRDLGEEGIDAGISLERKKSMQLQVPMTSPTAAEPETSDQNAPPTNDASTATSPEKTIPSDKVSSPQNLPPDDRRPSLAVSVTSSDLARRDRPSSIDLNKEGETRSSTGARADQPERRTSVLSSASKMDVSSLKSQASKLPEKASIDDNEERVLREAGLLEANNSTQGQNVADQKSGEPQTAPQEEQLGRVRHSLHRSLRDSHHGPQLRNKKTRGSGSSHPAGEEEQGAKGDEGLPRKTPSFNFHGRKASIVTFGSEWQNLPAEERLKLRKPTPSDDQREAGSTIIADSASETVSGGRPQSLRSASTATKSFRAHDDAPDALTVLGGEDRAENANDPGPKFFDADETPQTTARASTLNGRLAVPPDGSPVAEDDNGGLAAAAAHQEKTQASPQAVNA